jgi:basic membrane protein A and related proteins
MSYWHWVSRYVVAVVSLPAACGFATLSGAPAMAQEKAKIALVLNQPEGDPFGDLVYSGLEHLKKDTPAIELKRIAGVQAAAYEQQIRALINQGYNPVLVLWDDLAAVVAKMAPNYPNEKFIVVDSYADPKQPNVETVAVDPTSSAFLGGVVAATISKTGKLGFVGGADQPVIEKYLCGFRSGIESVAPKDEIIVNYAGTFIDPKKGQEVALAQIEQGADVLMHAANRTGLGVLKAAAEKGKYGVGVDLWQGDVAPGHVPFTAVKDAGNATYHVVGETLAGSFHPGQFVWDAKSGAQLYDQRDLDAMDPETKSAALDAIEKLKSGAIKPNC